MSSEGIKCEECGKLVHSIKVHCAKEHDENSLRPLTFEQYVAKYPDAPVLSDKAKAALEAKLREKQGAIEKPAESRLKVKMSELFEIDPSLLSGKDNEIEICQQEGYEQLIPKYKANYVYNIDLLRTVIMAIQENKMFYIYGHGGLGKSSIIAQVCSKLRRRRIRMQHTVNMEEADIKGRWVVEKEVVDGVPLSVMRFQLGPLAQCMLNGWVYLADEYDRAPPSVLSVYQAVLEGDSPLHIPEAPEGMQFIEPHPDFRFCATGNTNGSGDDCGLYSATITQDAATMDRFELIIKVDYMPPDQEAAVLRGTVPIKQKDAEALAKLASRTRDMFPQQVGLPFSPRSLISAAKIGLLKGSYIKGVELCYANRLPSDERKAVMELAQRAFGA